MGGSRVKDLDAMKCEVCGREIPGKPIRAVIEGAKLLVCPECARYASGTWKEGKPKPPVVAKPRVTRRLKAPEELELVPDFGRLVRGARERRRLSQEELGRMVGEKASVIRRIESGKMAPSMELARKLERTLGIKLLEPPPEAPAPTKAVKIPTLTLGDVVKLRVRERRDE